MARQILNTGSTANDNTGDTLRTAGTKMNANFQEIYSLLGGDNVTTGVTTSLTDSGLNFYGVAYDTRLIVTEGASSHIVTIPAGTDTVVLTNIAATLTNKSLTSPVITDPVISTLQLNDVDSSHQYTIVTGALSANHNLNIPSLTDSDTIVLLDATQTLYNKTMLNPILDNPTMYGHVKDTNGADIIHLLSTLNATNHIDIINSITGVGPTIGVEGDVDTNINLNINAAGTGAVKVSKLAHSKSTISAAGTVSANATYISFTGSTTATITVGNGTVDGQTKIVTHDGGAIICTVTFSSLAQGNSISLDANDTVSLIWNNALTEWNIIGGYGYSVS